jgi:hypothetical protein
MEVNSYLRVEESIETCLEMLMTALVTIPTQIIECTSVSMNRPGFCRHLASSLRNAFQTLPVTADC